MRLLPKKQVNAELATQRKELIDQGVKTAEKVDAVRDTLSKEEKRLRDFREQSVLEVTKEIEILLKERDSVKTDVQKEEKKLAKLRVPLDEEWLKVQDLREELDSRSSLLDQFAYSLEEKKQEIGKQANEVQVALQRAEEKDRQSGQFLIESERKITEINIRLDEAKRVKLDSERDSSKREHLLSIREESIKNMEQALSKRWEENDNRTLELNIREAQIQDREDTLARNIKRYG